MKKTFTASYLLILFAIMAMPFSSINAQSDNLTVKKPGNISKAREMEIKYRNSGINQNINTNRNAAVVSPVNDTICGAITLVLNGPFETDDTNNANPTDASDALATAAGYDLNVSTPNNTLWYSYTSATTETIQLVYTAPTANGLYGWLGEFSATSCAGPLTYINYMDNGALNSGDTVIANFAVTAGETYYFMVDGVVGATGIFSLGIRSIISGQPCSGNLSNSYLFTDPGGNPSGFVDYLCDTRDSVGAVIAEGNGYYNGDGYLIRLYSGSQVTFRVDNCAGFPVALTVCDSVGTPIPGFYATDACPNSVNFTAPYDGRFMIVMSVAGACGIHETTMIGDLYCVKQTGTSLPACLVASIPNDSICGAISLIQDGAYVAGNNTLALSYDADDAIISADYFCDDPSNTLWYNFTATTSGNVNIALVSDASDSIVALVGVWESGATCHDPMTYVNCYTLITTAGDTANTIFPATTGTNYYLMIDGGATSTGAFQIAVQTGPGVPVNDTICGAIDLVLDDPLISGNTQAALSTDPRDADVGAAGFDLCSTPNNTMWYSYTPAATDSIDIIYTADGSAFAGWLGVFSTPAGSNSCNGTLTNVIADCFYGPNTGTFGDVSTNRIEVVAGNTYYFMIDGVSGDIGPFSIGLQAVTTGINEFENNLTSISIFPNPGNEQVKVNYTFAHSNSFTIELLDINGRLVYSAKALSNRSGQETIDVRNFNNGVYILRLSNDSGSISRKVMVSH